MHYIQQHILDTLIFAEFLRNRDMRPPRVESNLYQYHLKELQKDGYIKKVDSLYTLTKKGLQYAGSHSTTLKKPRPQPTVLVVVFVERPDGMILIRTKQRQPFIGKKSLFMGKVHLEESIIDTAQREFTEKTGADSGPYTFEQFATVHMIIRQEDCVVSDYVGLLVKTRVGSDFCAPNAVFMDPAQEINELAPGANELITLYCNGDSFGEHSVAMQ